MLTIIILIILGTGIFPLAIYLIKTMQREPMQESAAAPLDANLALRSEGEASRRWWESLRGRFNRHLMIGGVFAIILYYSLIFSELGRYQYLQFTFSWWHFAFVCSLYLIYMGIANLFYNMGMLAESNYKPAFPLKFRQKAYRLIALLATVAPFVMILMAAFL